MGEDVHELPVAEVHRGCEIYADQSDARIRKARRQIDKVIAMADPRRLAAFAADAKNSPEARLLAKRKAMASREDRQRALVSVELLHAATIGIDRCTTPLGREIGFIDAARANSPWPDAWLPPE